MTRGNAPALSLRSALTQQPTDQPTNQPTDFNRCGKLKIGDIITAIGGDSVLDNQLSHVDVLRRYGLRLLLLLPFRVRLMLTRDRHFTLYHHTASTTLRVQ